MKKLSVIAIFVVFLFSATSVYALNYLGLILDDGVGNSTTLYSDTGTITFNGTLGNWTINVTTAITYPYLGSTSSPVIDLNSVNVSSSSGGTMNIYASASGFSPPSVTGQTGFVFDVGGTTSGTVQYIAYYDNVDDYLFWTFYPPLMDSGVISNSPFAYSFSGPIPDDAVDYTLFAQIIHTDGGATSFDAEFSTVPEPTTMLLLGSGLIGLAGFARRRFKK